MNDKTFTLFWGNGPDRMVSTWVNVPGHVAISLVTTTDEAGALGRLAVGAEFIDYGKDTWVRTA